MQPMSSQKKSEKDLGSSSTTKKRVSSEEVPNEIERLERRLTYMRRRKKMNDAGQKTSRFRKDGSLRLCAEPLYTFYRTWIKSGEWKRKYALRRKNCTYYAQLFVRFHNDLYNAVDKYGTQAEKDAIHYSLFAKSASKEIQEMTKDLCE